MLVVNGNIQCPMDGRRPFAVVMVQIGLARIVQFHDHDHVAAVVIRNFDGKSAVYPPVGYGFTVVIFMCFKEAWYAGRLTDSFGKYLILPHMLRLIVGHYMRSICGRMRYLPKESVN